jgi:hypothetical protein
MRSRVPSASPVARTRSRTAAISLRASPPGTADTPVGARNSPNTSRSTPAHSPVVTPALAHVIEASMRLASVCVESFRAASRRPSSAASTAAVSRSARHAWIASTAAASTAGSTVSIAAAPSACSGLGSVVANRFTPTTTTSPDSIRRRRSASDATSCPFMYPDSTAATAPPLSATRSISARAAATSSATFASTTREPSKGPRTRGGRSRGQHLYAQRPLLVPRPRQAERLVPRRKLIARAHVAGERDGEHLQHDALHVVLRLGLRQAQRVDLHPVAQPALARSSTPRGRDLSQSAANARILHIPRRTAAPR